ncbi:expressed unknown protein [Ectocarpus siliculosus]|uniref:Uncharacterized protein n=1 Tax=Ectocarpus siliculosus TaxID=2880 RepID=D7FYR8_ECTSI|nr:expressed unknown protein [Ectocarpus siliculosus]|eukprot:CBJ26560.1 expressed unknown protein [Ectocarpus siliculosus]
MHVGANKQAKAAFERSSAISGDMCVQIRTQRRRRGKGNSSCLRRGEDKSARNITPTDSRETPGALACTAAAHHQQRQHTWSVR